MARSKNKIEGCVIEQKSQLRGVSTMQIRLQAKKFAKEMKIHRIKIIFKRLLKQCSRNSNFTGMNKNKPIGAILGSMVPFWSY